MSPKLGLRQCVNNMEFTSSMFTSKVNIRPFFSPFTINLPWFFMFFIKHPFGLNVACKPYSTIWPMETNFFYYGWNMKYIFQVIWCCNPSLGLVTKTKGLQGSQGKRKPGSHITYSWEFKKCEGVWGSEPSHSQGNSHFGKWNPDGLLKL